MRSEGGAVKMARRRAQMDLPTFLKSFWEVLLAEANWAHDSALLALSETHASSIHTVLAVRTACAVHLRLNGRSP